MLAPPKIVPEDVWVGSWKRLPPGAVPEPFQGQFDWRHNKYATLTSDLYLGSLRCGAISRQARPKPLAYFVVPPGEHHSGTFFRA